ncbi:MAG: LptF/LptG family permease [Phycisphaerae bacterium]|nr:LptF/LptG family permease [Phycisphaerae bacterium]
MKILDKYVAKNFLIGYAITFAVLIGLVLVIDLFVNLGEFAKNAELGAGAVTWNIVQYYMAQMTLWFRDMAGMITVVAATFSLARLTYNNELVAVMASGVSLKRIMAPIIFLAILLTGLLIIDQEYLIPKLAPQLVRSHDEVPGGRTYDLWFMADNNGSLICTNRFDETTQTMLKPTIILRESVGPIVYRVTGWIRADKAVYNAQSKGWDLTNGIYQPIAQQASEVDLIAKPEPFAFYKTDMNPEEIPLRQQEDYKSLLSSAQLAELARTMGTRVRDQAEFYLHKHSRITKPIINMVMLLVALPVLVCRDPKRMKSAILSSFGITGACFVVTFVCEMMATEVFFDRIRPELWAWAPVFIFLPIAVLEIDGMNT